MGVWEEAEQPPWPAVTHALLSKNKNTLYRVNQPAKGHHKKSGFTALVASFCLPLLCARRALGNPSASGTTFPGSDLYLRLAPFRIKK